jgi:glyoxylase-like metal-dependent hydrolase (beta-lactamase superfamily II)
MEEFGGNILLCHGEDGNAMVDSDLATSPKQVGSAIGHVSARPLRHLLNTHWHFDHTDGNLCTQLAQPSLRTTIRGRG